LSEATHTSHAAPATQADGRVTALADGLVVLSNPFLLDGGVSTHPLRARGYAPMQCYLLKEDDRALLVGSGLTIHEKQVLGQVEAELGSARLSFIPSGADFTRLCNARPIADRFGLEFVYQLPLFDIPTAWLNFRPEFPADESDRLRAAEVQPVRTGIPIALAPGGARDVEVLVPPLRLLPNNWLYDVETRTMFTIDLFTWVWRSDDAGPWVVTDADDDATTEETVAHALFDNRYWWLPGADTTRMRRALADLFERYPVENIAPECGCALKGPGVVSRHYQLFDDVLASAPRRPAQGVEVGQWTFGEAQ
jgi:hypothetical protein